MAVLKVKNGDEWIPVAGGGGGGASAWVNFNGKHNQSGLLTKRGDFNVTSVTDEGAGDYTVNFENSLPTDSYAVAHGCGGTPNAIWYRGSEDVEPRTVDSYRFMTLMYNNAGRIDPEYVSVTFFAE